VPVACPMRWSLKGYDSYSRIPPQAPQSAFTHMSLLAEET
jgi:hypothetical protein